MEQFARAVDGLATACKALDVPIVSGNVSLYNETTMRGEDGALEPRSILPTPTVAAVGLVGSRADIVTASFKRAGDVVLILGKASSTGARALAGSEWLTRSLGKLVGEGPLLELSVEAQLQKLVLRLARSHLLSSAHDVSDGGLAVALAECCAAGPEDVGVSVVLPRCESALQATAELFGEAPSRIVVSVAPGSLERVLAEAHSTGVDAVRVGETGGDALRVTIEPLGTLSVPVAAVRERRDGCLRGIVGE
jgi:phosphoribosylformylglycinamidine synthase